MGTSRWSDDYYREREADRSSRGTSVFEYHETIRSKPVSEQKVHPQMDPKGVTRESRDSETHPESIAIGVILDETGSMSGTPIVMQKSLPRLMNLLVSRGVKDPQVLFGAVGDETNHERASLQIGQFESGLEMEDDLGRIFMEKKGGGSYEESYQNVLYFFARHTSCDCFEKRGRRGYLFIVGDEHPYPIVKRHEVEKLFGDKIQDDIPVEEIVAECQKKWDVYFVLPGGTQNCRDRKLHEYWEKMLGKDHLIHLSDPGQICEAVAGALSNTTVPEAKDDDGIELL